MPLGTWIHDRAATFTMTLCAPTREEAHSVAKESFAWYPKAGALDLLRCLVNPYEIPHDEVMQTIELMGTHGIPKFR